MLPIKLQPLLILKIHPDFKDATVWLWWGVGVGENSSN